MLTKLPKLALFALILAALVLSACDAGGAADEEMADEEMADEEMADEEHADEEHADEEMADEEMMDFTALEYAPGCDAGSAIGAIVAEDAYTVRFELCAPDPAFLSKAAFSAFGIYSDEQIAATGGTGELLEAPVGTGPYVVDAWNRGESIVFTANPSFWGDAPPAETLVFRWSAEGAARLLELQSGTVDGIDNPSPDDFATIAGDDNLQLIERPALNVLYLAMTNTFEPFDNVDVRRAIAMGIDRQRIVDNFYPAGSEVASHFTPCAIPNGCVGDEWYEFDADAARTALADAGYPDGFETTIYYRDVFRGYLPEPGLVAVELQTQLRENLGIEADIVVMESGEFIEESTAGNLDGFYMLGWGADYPHVTNFLDFHFSEANPQFGTPHPEVYEVLAEAAQIGVPADAEDLYVQANNALRDLVPMIPVAHGGSGTAFQADVDGAHASPLSNEYFAAMTPGDRDTIVWMQNAEPIGLYCGDMTDGESLRACEQVNEALYAYEVGGTDVHPALATECTPNDDLTVWTCTLREGVTFSDGTAFDANDVIASWSTGLDAANPNHVGSTGAFEYYSYLWGLVNAEE